MKKKKGNRLAQLDGRNEASHLHYKAHMHGDAFQRKGSSSLSNMPVFVSYLGVG